MPAGLRPLSPPAAFDPFSDARSCEPRHRPIRDPSCAIENQGHGHVMVRASHRALVSGLFTPAAHLLSFSTATTTTTIYTLPPHDTLPQLLALQALTGLAPQAA